MVSYQDILDSNALINESNGPQTAVFVGGTAGIGQLTIRALVRTRIGIRIYLVGRKSSSNSAQEFIEEQKVINSKAEIIWIEGEVSLLKDVKRICEIIKAKESKIDLLFLTAGYAPFKGRELTSEGLEITQSLEYYSRMLFTQSLLSLLKQSETARVISVLSGGLERASIPDAALSDLNFEKPGAFSALKTRPVVGAMNTLFLDHLAQENEDITFIHSWPGLINTGNAKRSYDPTSWTSPISWLFYLVIEPVLYWFSTSEEMAMQRYLFLAKNAYIGGKGVPCTAETGLNSAEEREGAVYLTKYDANCTPNAKNVKLLREQAQEKVVAKTKDVLESYL